MNMKMLVASQSGKKDFLDRMIVKKLLLKEAKKENVEKEKEFQDRLADIKEQLIIESLLKKKVNSRGRSLADADLEKYYEDHKEEFKKGQGDTDKADRGEDRAGGQGDAGAHRQGRGLRGTGQDDIRSTRAQRTRAAT